MPKEMNIKVENGIFKMEIDLDTLVYAFENSESNYVDEDEYNKITDKEKFAEYLISYFFDEEGDFNSIPNWATLFEQAFDELSTDAQDDFVDYYDDDDL
jgi:hypothetical protein